MQDDYCGRRHVIEAGVNPKFLRSGRWTHMAQKQRELGEEGGQESRGNKKAKKGKKQ